MPDPEGFVPDDLSDFVPDEPKEQAKTEAKPSRAVRFMAGLTGKADPSTYTVTLGDLRKDPRSLGRVFSAENAGVLARDVGLLGAGLGVGKVAGSMPELPSPRAALRTGLGKAADFAEKNPDITAVAGGVLGGMHSGALGALEGAAGGGYAGRIMRALQNLVPETKPAMPKPGATVGPVTGPGTSGALRIRPAESPASSGNKGIVVPSTRTGATKLPTTTELETPVAPAKPVVKVDPKTGKRLVLTPEEAAADAQLQAIERLRAQRQGMINAGAPLR